MKLAAPQQRSEIIIVGRLTFYDEISCMGMFTSDLSGKKISTASKSTWKRSKGTGTGYY